MGHYLNDPKYRESERKRYEQIDRERRNGLRAGCIECNRRDARPSVGVCYVCERKIRAEHAYLGIDLDSISPAYGGPHSNQGKEE